MNAAATVTAKTGHGIPERSSCFISALLVGDADVLAESVLEVEAGLSDEGVDAGRADLKAGQGQGVGELLVGGDEVAVGRENGAVDHRLGRREPRHAAPPKLVLVGDDLLHVAEEPGIDAALLLELSQTLASSLDMQLILHTVSRLIAEVIALVCKTSLIGFFVGLICASKGLNSPSGSEGLGRAVNQAVVVCVLAVCIIDTLFGMTVMALVPELSTGR